MRILLIDDDKDISSELKECLVEDGHKVETVYSGPEALDHLCFYQYDVIVLDYHLPGKEGVEVCSEFRSTGGITPIVMLTGDSFPESKVACLEAGANTFLEKPFSLQELTAVMAGLVKTG